jgi:Phage integrase family
VVGKVEVSRPYYLCPHCHAGQFPADVELDIENREFSPGVRRMQAMVGQEAPFDQGRQQMKLLADLEVTTKAVERTAEAIGEDGYASAAGIPGIAPHDLRRSCAKMCRTAGGELEQIQLLLGHASVQTTERYLGTRQDLVHAPNDGIKLRVAV